VKQAVTGFPHSIAVPAASHPCVHPGVPGRCGAFRRVNKRSFAVRVDMSDSTASDGHPYLKLGTDPGRGCDVPGRSGF